jgi:hypothetical protein
MFFFFFSTAKVNNLRVKPYLEEVLRFMRGYVNGSGNIDDILPWAGSMQERFFKPNNSLMLFYYILLNILLLNPSVLSALNRIFRGHVLSQDASAEQYVVFSEIRVHNYLCFTLISD